MRLLVCFGLACTLLSGQTCPVWSAAPSADYKFLIASADHPVPAGTAYQWGINGNAQTPGTVAQTFLLHADGDTTSTEGIAPLSSSGVSFGEGRWGSALTVGNGGHLSYPRTGAYDVKEGAVEMWIAPVNAGNDPGYSAREHVLFQYQAPNGDYMKVAQSAAGIIYGGGAIAGKWESAYGGQAAMSAWNAGEWHHVVFTYSAAANNMRLYVDGVLTAENNEGHYLPPDGGSDRFYLGQTPGGTPAAYWIDEVRLWSRTMTAAEITANASRTVPPANDEVWLPLGTYSAGDSLVFQAGACSSPTFAYQGIPVTAPNPASTLLAPGTTSLQLSVQSSQPASCGYAVGAAAALQDMTPFDSGQGMSAHQTQITGLTADPAKVNQVYVRCDNSPDYAMQLLYRSVPTVNPDFPRKSNLWGSSGLWAGGVDHAARIDMYLGATFTQGQIQQLRAKNPNILILNSINTVENSGLAEDYYLHDIHGKRIEVWPGTFRLNLTKSYVAEYQANFAYQLLLNSGLLLDGCFFDNFFTTQSWLKTDIYGNPVQIDANEDGIPDDPAWLDGAWHDGVYHELNTFRQLMPNAFASGHLPRPPAAEFSTIFNGDSIGFLAPETADGTVSFASLQAAYQNWWSIGRTPVITMVEGAPPFQIGYGYGYNPQANIPPSTLEFARTYYPYMRFALAVTLMNDGYYAYEFGDTWHGNDWWYDEFDFNLGQPLGAAQNVAVSSYDPSNLLDNAGFEASLTGTWLLEVTKTAGAAATATVDHSTFVEGNASLRLDVTGVDGTNWHVDFEQQNRKLTRGVTYDLTFWAKADTARVIAVDSQKNGGDYRNYGLSQSINIGTDWKQYTATFQANETVTDARIQFWAGQQTGQVWLDGIQLAQHPPDVYRRDFTNGIALLNGTRQQQTIDLGSGFHRINGTQAPRYEYIIDDASPQFTASGPWHTAQYDSGTWKAAGPYFHTWGAACHQLDGTTGTAQWDLSLRADDSYTIDAWWPAAPSATTWSKQVVFEVVAAGKVVSSVTVDQSTGGDQWHTIASVPLSVADAPVVRIRNLGAGPAIADALHIRSASRYNDGSAVTKVTLEPMDGIVLGRN